MAPSLPNKPSLERFRRDARRLQRAAREGDAEALALLSRHHPAGAPVDPAGFALTAAQHVVARAVGFSSWPRLQAYLHTADQLRSDPTIDAGDDPPASFLSLACLTYSHGDGPHRWSAASEVLDAHPDLPERSLFVAATVGDPEAVRAHLDNRPDGVRDKGGPFGWTALFHLAASRVPQRDPLTTALILLDAGSDPNADTSGSVCRPRSPC